MFIDAADLDLTDVDTLLATAAAAERRPAYNVDPIAFLMEIASTDTAEARAANDVAVKAQRAAYLAACDASFSRFVAPPSARLANPCKKCSGYGRIDAYAHIANGICYRCGGTGHE
jgi:hypothetical protein